MYTRSLALNLVGEWKGNRRNPVVGLDAKEILFDSWKMGRSRRKQKHGKKRRNAIDFGAWDDS